MLVWPSIMQVQRIAAILLALYLILVTVVYFCQRSLLFIPSHRAAPPTRLTPWSDGGQDV